MELIIICAVLGCIPATIASSKGHSFFAWWIYGALLFIIALIHSLVLKKDLRVLEEEQLREGMVKCPFCAELIKSEAIKCKHCGSDVKDEREATTLENFKPIDMSFDSFFIRTKEGFDVNDESVTTLVSRLKQANPWSNPMQIKGKYRAQIDDLVDQLPSGIRDEFMRKYDAEF